MEEHVNQEFWVSETYTWTEFHFKYTESGITLQ